VRNVFIFSKVDDITRVGFTVVIFSIVTGFQSECYYLLCGRYLYFTDIVAMLCSIEFFPNVMFCENGVEKLNVVAFCS